MDMDVFFKSVRTSLFDGKMTAPQVKGCERLIQAWNQYGYGLHTGMAYCLAISYHETGRRMQPVRETHATSTEQAKARLEKAFKAGQLKWVKTPYWRSGWFGRGDVQLTHEANYNGAMRAAVLNTFQVDIHRDPDLALRPDISAFIMIEGVTKGVTAKSEFTGSSLEMFINDKKTDYANARKTVNPNEKSSYELLAEYARKFEKAIALALKEDGEDFIGIATVPESAAMQKAASKMKLAATAKPAAPASNRIPVSLVGDTSVGAGPVTTEITKVSESVSGGISVETETEVPETLAVPIRAKTTKLDAGIYDGAVHEEVRIVQELLRSKLFFSTGKVDGKWGNRTSEAVLAFRRESGLPLVDAIDDAFLVALVKAAPRHIAPERANATVEDIKTAPTIQDGLTLESIGKWAWGIGGLGAIGTGGLTLADVQEKVTQVQAIYEVIRSALPFLAVVGVGFVVVYFARKIIKEHLVGYREGRHV